MGGVVEARRSKPIVEAIARDHDLADDLAGREVAHEPLRAGVAERASERAANLTGEAKRAAVRLRDINAFDLMRSLERVLAGQAQEPFARATGRDLLGNDFGTCQREMLLERRAQLSRDAGHGLEPAGAAYVEPMPDLLHAHLALHRRHANACERLHQLRARQAHERGL